MSCASEDVLFSLATPEPDLAAPFVLRLKIVTIYTIPGNITEVEHGPLDDHFTLQTVCFPLP